MKRTRISLEDVAAWDHLAWAFWRAASGKRHRPEVQAFADRLEENLAHLREGIVAGTLALGRFRRFEIRDPKPRTIHAPCFRERVLHHALMARVEPVIERALVDDTFACRPGRGSWAAVLRAQEHTRRWPWFLKMDIRSYFASIDHGILRQQIRRRIKGQRVLRLIDRILASYETTPGRGLPIGALTSQHFANLYLASLDRYLLEKLRVGGMARYMDDVVAWGGDREPLLRVLEEATHFAREHLDLEIKESWQLQRGRRGLTFCGIRIYPRRLAMTARRRRRYRQIRAHWERAYEAGRCDANELQAGYASALALTRGLGSRRWRRRELELRPAVDA